MLRNAFPVPNCGHVNGWCGNLQPVTMRRDSSLILMQSTGLADMRGREIFEGDVVRTACGFNIVVRWERECCDGMLEHVGFGIGEPSWCKIIGNIYENRKLING